MIAYITGSNPRFSVEEERKRIAAVNQRRPVRLRTVREVPLFESAVFASFDAMFFIGNEYNLKSYSDLTLPPVYFIPNTGYEHLLRLPVPAEDRSPGEFIFLGSAGQVHKGLDLLLEIFPRHPELNLHVCSPFEGEPDFCRAYAKELYQTRNVHAHGFVDIAGEKFSRLCRRCTYQVLPSCSEARAGAVITGMSAGLIPIISEPCGFDREDGGIVFEDCSIETVERTLLEAAGRDHDWRKRESARIRERVRSHYMPEVYGRRIREVISQVIDGKHGDGTT